MATPSQTQTTAFTRDVVGRYVCNGLDEALASTTGDPGCAAVRSYRDRRRLVRHRARRTARAPRRHRRASHPRARRGAYVYPEHVQNLPPGLDSGEVWGVPWNSDSPQSWNQPLPRARLLSGGRSVFWGGWSPYFIDSELPSAAVAGERGARSDAARGEDRRAADVLSGPCGRQIGTRQHERLREGAAARAATPAALRRAAGAARDAGVDAHGESRHADRRWTISRRRSRSSRPLPGPGSSRSTSSTRCSCSCARRAWSRSEAEQSARRRRGSDQPA